MYHKFLVLLLPFSLSAAEIAKEVPAPMPFVIGISPFLDKSVKDDVYRSIVRLLVQDLPLNSTVAIYDAFNLKSITQVTLPNARVFDSAKTRANQFAGAIGDVKLFLAGDHLKPPSSHLKFDSAIQVPQFLDFLNDNVRLTNASAEVLL